jgi:3-oxoacyl-[acyl-carrier-protein] synthase III
MEALDIHVASVGTALPGPPIDNVALARRFGMSDQWLEWLDMYVGTRTRHLALDLASGEPRESLADLGVLAGERALQAAGIEPDEVDLLVMGTALPDQLMPTTANVVADRLRIDGIPSFQLQSGCTGAFQALSLACQLLTTGRYATALVLGGDVSRKFFDVRRDLAALPPEQMIHYVLFGDGAGAVLLTVEEVANPVRIREVFTRLTGLDRRPGQTVDWLGPADPPPSGVMAAEDYKAIEAAVPPMSTEIQAELLTRLNWTENDIDHVLPPQLSARMTALILKELGLPRATEVSCVKETANIGNATPFFQLERLFPLMSRGDRALAISVESSKWIKAGLALDRG